MRGLSLALLLLACLPAKGEELLGVPWGETARMCVGELLFDRHNPPRNWVRTPWYVGEGFISTDSQLCHLTRIEGVPGSYVADCEFAHWDEQRRYTITMQESGDTLTMIWKSLASPQTYPAKIGPLHKCGLGKAVPVPWTKADDKWTTTD